MKVLFKHSSFASMENFVHHSSAQININDYYEKIK